jgi:peptide/nickel transport system ATP-binding protein
MNKLLEVKNVSYSVKTDRGFTNILDNINFYVEKNKTLGVAGESGSGKTTLGKLVAGIIEPTTGEMIFNFEGSKTLKKPNPVQILFQNNGEILNPFRNVLDIIDEAIKIKTGKVKVNEKRAHLFDSLNFAKELWNRKGSELSGGEQQRAALARLLAVEPELIILDEPFSAQDPESQLNFLNLFLKLKKEFNITLICIAHNLKILRKLCDEILIIYKGSIVEKGETEKIFSKPEHPYTKYLISAENYDLSYEQLKSTI